MATLTITLPDDLAATVRARVAAGEYPDEGAAIADALRANEELPEFSDAWRAEIAATVDRIDAGTEPLYTAEEVLAHLAEARRRRHG